MALTSDGIEFADRDVAAFGVGNLQDFGESLEFFRVASARLALVCVPKTRFRIALGLEQFGAVQTNLKASRWFYL